MAPKVEVEALKHGFGGRPVLDVPSWRVGAGEHCLVVGRSGSGKSTLLHLLAGLAAPREGSIRVAGQDLAALSAPRPPATASGGGRSGCCSRPFPSSTR